MTVLGMFVGPSILLIAVASWIVYGVLAATRRGGSWEQLAGWGASIFTSLGLGTVVPFVIGLLLYLPVLAASRTGVASLLAWSEAIVLTAVVVGLAYLIVTKARTVRFLVVPLVVLGLGSVWMGRWIATSTSWLPTPS